MTRAGEAVHGWTAGASPGYGRAAVLDGVQDVEHAHEGRLDRRRPRAVAATVRTSGARRRDRSRAAAFDQDGRQHAKAVAESVQVAHPVDPGMLETRHLSDAESFRRYPHMDQGLDLEAVAPQPPVALADGGEVTSRPSTGTYFCQNTLYP